jgi:hypothetical protein
MANGSWYSTPTRTKDHRLIPLDASTWREAMNPAVIATPASTTIQAMLAYSSQIPGAEAWRAHRPG